MEDEALSVLQGAEEGASASMRQAAGGKKTVGRGLVHSFMGKRNRTRGEKRRRKRRRRRRRRRWGDVGCDFIITPKDVLESAKQGPVVRLPPLEKRLVAGLAGSNDKHGDQFGENIYVYMYICNAI